jgi:hypothetical protein
VLALIRVEIEQTGARRYRKEPEDAIELARRLLAETRQAGVRVPRVAFFVAGRLVRGGYTRTDLAVEFGRCWCGRGALYRKSRQEPAFCCAAHEYLWGTWSANLRARVIVARFLAIYGGGR